MHPVQDILKELYGLKEKKKKKKKKKRPRYGMHAKPNKCAVCSNAQHIDAQAYTCKVSYGKF